MSKLAAVLVAALLALCVGEGLALWRLDRRLARLEAAPPVATGARHRAATSAESAEAVAAAVETVRGLEERVTVLERDRESGPEPLASSAEGLDARPADPSSAPAGGSMERRLEEVVDRKVAERLKDREEAGGAGEEKKPSIAALSAAVSMTAEQENAAVRALDEGKRRAFDLLGLPRPDGSSLLDDLVGALKSAEDPGAATQKWFQRLLTERIPGRTETYLAEILRIQKSVWDGLGAALDEGQVTKLRRLGIDVLQVNTGYDPFAELLAGR